MEIMLRNIKRALTNKEVTVVGVLYVVGAVLWAVKVACSEYTYL
jgi:hypothetical protein